MKRVDQRVACIFFGLAVLLPAQYAAESPKPDLAVIEFGEKTLKLNKHEIKYPFAMDEIIAAIGKPDRSASVANVVHTWDQYGIVAFQKAPGEPIHALQIIYCNDTPQFAPEKLFTGTVLIKDTQFTPSSDRRDLLRAGFAQDRLLTDYYTAKIDGVSLVAKYKRIMYNLEISR